MEKRSNFVLDNAINAYEHTADSALDRCTLDFLKELRGYRDLEEQGLLLRLPCKVGDTVYEIHPSTGKISQRKIKSIVVCNCPDLTIMYKSGYDYSNVQDDFGKTVFLTKEEAEQKLKELRGVSDGTME